jgi:hypothetical protein
MSAGPIGVGSWGCLLLVGGIIGAFLLEDETVFTIFTGLFNCLIEHSQKEHPFDRLVDDFIQRISVRINGTLVSQPSSESRNRLCGRGSFLGNRHVPI